MTINKFLHAGTYSSFVLTVLGVLDLIFLLRGALLAAGIMTLLFVGVLLQSKWAILLSRALFGLAAALAPLVFFNVYFLGDYAKDGDWVKVLLVAGGLFIGFEAVFVAAFICCGKLTQSAVEPAEADVTD